MKAIKFATIGSLGFVVDSSVFFALTQLDMGTMQARLYAFWLAASSTWLGNKYFTFQCRARSKLLRQWSKHMASCHVSGVANLAIFYCLNPFIHTAIAFVIGILAAAIANYWLSQKYVFALAS